MMKNTLPLLLGIGGATALLMAMGSGGSSVGPFPRGPGKCATTPAERAASRERVRSTAAMLGSRYGISGLDVYLDTVAYWESRYNPCASGDGGASLGLFQMQVGPVNHVTFNNSPIAKNWRDKAYYTDPLLSIILATGYAMSAGNKMVDKGEQPNWLAVRRWWKYPSLLLDFDEQNKESSGVRTRFASALLEAGYDPSFMEASFDPSKWPGTPQVLKEFGYDPGTP